MKGIVKGINQQRTRAAVLTDQGYTVFDIEDGEVSFGDTISGNLNDHGSYTLNNLTTGSTLDVYIQAIQATTEATRSLLAY